MRSFPVFLALAAFLLACTGGGSAPAAQPVAAEPEPEPEPVYVPPPPMPNWVIGDTSINNACAGMFSDCTRTTCIVINSGDGGGSVNAEMTVTSASGQELSHGEALYIEPGGRKTISHDFDGFAAARLTCTIR